MQFFRRISGSDPREPLEKLLSAGLSLPGLFASSNPADLWNFAFRLAAQADRLQYPVSKPKLTDVDTILGLIDNATRIVVLMGAGASVGQDFRSPGGLYNTIRELGALADPYRVFDLELFDADPSIFWRFAHLVFPPEVPQFSSTHRFLQELEERGKLLRLDSRKSNQIFDTIFHRFMTKQTCRYLVNYLT